MALLLPRGIVVNHASLEGNIGNRDNEPVDTADIAKLWKVYTTTKRRLLDPTAERLENYWWRIWGSRKRELDGATVARLFAQISDGETFVPLRGPPNRDEGTPPLNTKARLGPGASSTTALYTSSNQGRPSTTSSSTTTIKSPASMPPPILKKHRGPSSTGPRPTARFISPHDTEEESHLASPISENSHVSVQPPSPSINPPNTKSEKKGNGTASKKKGGFVASTAGKKKARPAISRRQSSQSSSETTARLSDTGQSSTMVHSSADRTPPVISDQLRGRGNHNTQSRFLENFSPSPDRSTKSKSKTSTPQSKNSSPHKPKSRKDQIVTSQGSRESASSTGDPGPSTRRSAGVLQDVPKSAENNNPPGLEEVATQRVLAEEGNTRLKSPRKASQIVTSPTSEGFQVLHASLRSRSISSQDMGEMGAMRMLQHDGKSTTSLAPTLTNATGRLEFGEAGVNNSLPVSERKSQSAKIKGKGRDPEEVQRAEVFTKRPLQPVQAAAESESPSPLSRSKSQLTLLLEKDRVKNGDNKYKRDRSSGKR